MCLRHAFLSPLDGAPGRDRGRLTRRAVLAFDLGSACMLAINDAVDVLLLSKFVAYCMMEMLLVLYMSCMHSFAEC